jgi:hypothetical protein
VSDTDFPDVGSLSASDLIDMSLALRQYHEFPAAVMAQMRAISLEPTNARAHVALAESLLLTDQYRPGFMEHQWRFTLEEPGRIPEFSSTPWTGYAIPAPGRLVVVGDQGFGDNIMFSRYLPWAFGRCTAMTLVIPPELSRLFEGRGWDVCSSWADIPPHAAWVRLSSLPMLHGTTFETLPPPLDWPGYKADDLPGDPGKARIGFCWHGQEKHEGQKARSVPFHQMSRLMLHPNVHPVCLQRDAPDYEQTMFPRPPENLTTWSDTAELIRKLDLVITTDTAIAHLAGSLGAPTWVLLKHDSDWRYGLSRAWNPWYKSHILFRQGIPGDWENVVNAANELLDALDPKP